MLTNVITEKACSRCKQILPATEFYPHRRMKSGLQSHCRTCSREWHRERPEYIRQKNAEYKAKNPDYARDWSRKARFGLTPAQINVMRESQGGLCAGCLRALTRANECVDHCHLTGKVRGLLCDPCNMSLGRLGDSPETLRRLAAYLEAEAY